MNKLQVLLITFCLLTFSSCKESAEMVLFDGTENNSWSYSGNSGVENNLLTLSGTDAACILKKGNYQDFELDLELRTTPGGKGHIGIHTDATGKGYRIAVNNDREDSHWWKMTGSLLSVRNLTKSFVKENDWFTMNVTVEGQVITVKVNGEPVVAYIEPTQPYRTQPNQNSVLSKGTFSLISTGSGELQFRKIEVKKLNRDAINIPAQLEAAREEQSDEVIKLHQQDFPVMDYHVHLKGGLTKEVAAKQSRETGINYVIAPNCGVGFPITNDEQIYSYLDTMRNQPFILAMQAEGREWVSTFSQEARDEFDFVFTDAMTFNDHKNRRIHLWINNEVKIDNEQRYVDMIVDRLCTVLQEPADVYVNPFFLPEVLQDRYDEFWTEARIDKAVDALAKSGKALEINARYKIPNKAIILKAKEKGIKFTFGTNNVEPEVSKLEYPIQMQKECGLKAEDMYKPKIKI